MKSQYNKYKVYAAVHARKESYIKYVSQALNSQTIECQSVTPSFCKFSLSSLKTTSNNVHSSFENVCKIFSR